MNKKSDLSQAILDEKPLTKRFNCPTCGGTKTIFTRLHNYDSFIQFKGNCSSCSTILKVNYNKDNNRLVFIGAYYEVVVGKVINSAKSIDAELVIKL